MPREIKQKKRKTGGGYRFNRKGYAYVNAGYNSKRGYYVPRENQRTDERNDLVQHRVMFKRPTGLEVTVKIWDDKNWIVLDKKKNSVMLTQHEYYDLVSAQDVIKYHVNRVNSVLSGKKVRELKQDFTELEKSDLRVKAEEMEAKTWAVSPESEYDEEEDDDATQEYESDEDQQVMPSKKQKVA